MSIRESIGNVTKLLVKVHDAELKAELQEALLNAQGEALDLQERLARFQEENAELREQLRSKSQADKLAEQLFYARDVYWRKDESIFSAYCPTCWDTKRLLVRLEISDESSWCEPCKQNFYQLKQGQQRPAPSDNE